MGFGFGSIVTFSFVCKLLLKSLASGVCKILKLGDVHHLGKVQDLILYERLVSEFKPTIVWAIMKIGLSQIIYSMLNFFKFDIVEFEGQRNHLPCNISCIIMLCG